MTLKQKIHSYYLQEINNKIESLQQVLEDLKKMGANETKSTAGDKHETALAMLQIEQANVRTRLKETLEQKASLQKINPTLTANIIVNGSLVKTNRGYLFISIAWGKTLIENNNVIALSALSPLGKKLMGLKVGSIAEVNNNSYIIESIE